MARSLLHSEIAILRAAGASLELIQSQQVSSEYHAPQRLKQRQWFNTDFVIELDNWNEDKRGETRIVPVRPLTFGADYFVGLTGCGIPKKLELLEGESIPRSSFRSEIGQIENVLNCLPALPRSISIESAPFVRIARLENCLAFLIASKTSFADLLSASKVPIKEGKVVLGYRTMGSDLLLDGVLFD